MSARLCNGSAECIRRGCSPRSRPDPQSSKSSTRPYLPTERAQVKAKSFQLSELATMNPAQPMGWLTTLGSRRQPVGAPPMPVAVGSRVQGASGLALRAGVACPISVGCRSRGPNLDLLDRFARGDDSPECKPEWLRDRTARAGYLADQPRRAARRRTCPSLRCVTTLASACTYSSMIRRNGTVGISRRACNVSGPNLKGLLELGCSAIDCRSRLPSTTVTGAPYEISRLRSSRASCDSSRRST